MTKFFQLLCPGVMVPIFPGLLFRYGVGKTQDGTPTYVFRILREEINTYIKLHGIKPWTLDSSDVFPSFSNLDYNYFLIQSPKTKKLALAARLGPTIGVVLKYDLWTTHGYDQNDRALKIGHKICELRIL